MTAERNFNQLIQVGGFGEFLVQVSVGMEYHNFESHWNVPNRNQNDFWLETNII
jgi:hypothetical protein